MVQKNKKPPSAAKFEGPVPPKRRGRPRAYQPDVALGKALDLFRRDGFAATSLDDLSAATGMNRPSLYGAFADPAVLAQLASATVHTIAIRARARVPRKELEAIVNGAIDLMVRA